MAARFLLGLKTVPNVQRYVSPVWIRALDGRKYTTDANGASMSLRSGYPVISISLPSRKEICDFTLRPHLQTVGELSKQIMAEDKGVDRVALYSQEGHRIAQSTTLDQLLQSNFLLEINGTKFSVEIPKNLKYTLEGEQSLSDVKNTIFKLYTALNVDAHQLSKELELKKQLEQLKTELEPLEHEHQKLALQSNKRTNWAIWAGLAYMSVQFGFFARLTWVDYSWDVMEPVTYFTTYGTSMAMFAYFILTRQEYNYKEAQNRQYLNFFYRSATQKKFDVDRYNHVKETITKVEGELERLHDPLQLNLPTPPLPTKSTTSE
ncbi:hypothetical protein EMCRGX_G035053 [Ephydatia muelleri]|eukprot:Em0023g891a